MSENNSEGKGHHVAHFHFKPPPDYTGHDMTEPLDLSKIKIGTGDPIHVVFDDNEPDPTDEDDDELNEEEEERFTRGRSRSRSVHSNDDDGSSYSYGTHTHATPPMYNPEDPAASSVEGEGGGDSSSGTSNESSNGAHVAPIGERTGPLQHREVVALQKGLEEAQQTLNKNSREDEEERMAADAEKRKRMLAANHQASSSANEPFKRFKLLLLGDSAVGKSSLILRWTMDTFSANLTSTVGVNFKSKKVQCFGEWIQVQVWDTAGQENFHKITTSYYRGAQGIMLVYDVTEKKSLENVTYWIKNIKAHASESVQIVLVGNKTDLRDLPEPPAGSVTTEMGRQVAQKFGIPFFETSAKSANHVEEAFMTLVAAISQSSVGSAAVKSSPSSPAPNNGNVSNNNSPMQGHPTGANGHSHNSNSSTNSSQSPPVDANKRSFFASLRRRSDTAAGAEGSVTTTGHAAAHEATGCDGNDKDKCIIS